MAQIHQKARNLYRVPAGYKPTRDRQVDVRSVPCGSCGAEVGEPCRSAKGTETQHASRRRMALRKMRELDSANATQ